MKPDARTKRLLQEIFGGSGDLPDLSPSQKQELAEGCDRCGVQIANGDGRHVGDYRVCEDCEQKLEKKND